MKKQSLFFALCTLLIHVSFAQTPATNSYPPNGNVGIGTTTPQTNLEINKSAPYGGVVGISIVDAEIPNQSRVLIGALKSTYDASIPTYSIPNIWFGDNALSPSYSNITFGYDAGMGPIFNAAASKMMQLRIDNGTKMAVGNAGVGIGIGQNVQPTYPFHVRTASDFIVNSNGNVGIGTTSPGVYKLAVTGGDIKSYNYDNNTGVSIGAEYSERARIGFHVSDNNRRFKIEVNGVNSASERLGFFCNNGGAWSETEVLSIGKTGAIGIGTTDTKGYKLAVNGDAVFTKVKVKTYSTWPDYVFRPAYKLPSLKEVESFIKQNQHLPGVISAKEVKENGLDIGENQAVLLRKIEELTLYMIELKKQIDAQQETIHDQQKTIQKQQHFLYSLKKKSLRKIA